MKRFVLLSLGLFAFSALNSKAQGLQAELDMARFDSPELGTYLDTYLKLKGNSLKLEKSANGLRSRVHLTYLVTENKDTAFYDSFILDGPMLATDSVRQDFIDAQRIKLNKGNYNLKITLADVNNADALPRTVEQSVAIRSATSKFKERLRKAEDPLGIETTEVGKWAPKEESILGSPVEYYFSDVILVDGIKKSVSPGILTKSGMDLIPYVSNFYPPEKKEITFYCEVYNTVLQWELNMKNFSNLFKDRTKAHKFLIITSIQEPETEKVIGNYASRQIVDSSAVIPVLQSFDIAELESGNYNLVFELRNFKNDLIDRKEVLFQRVNRIAQPEDDYLTSELSGQDQLDLTFVGKYNRPEMLEEYLRCLHPISSQEEIHQVNRRMNFNDMQMMKKFLYYFWKTRNPEDPEGAWLAYWKEVEKVNSAYSTNHKKGYDTDRGRVYLQYGAPNTISPNYFEPNTYPYEIWHYYRLHDHLSAEQSNRKFVFANLEQGTKEFDLIHSDAKNEITNRRWHHDLHSRSNMSVDLDQENGQEHFGGRSQDFFDNPY